MIILYFILIVLLVINLSVMSKLQFVTDRIDDNLVDIEMMRMKVEKVTEDLGITVFQLQEKIGGRM